ncbi:MAG: hypothetical protein M1493_04850 [Firmicutes bacterium]|nr:hypothetical protein [Bacillota bacterium]
MAGRTAGGAYPLLPAERLVEFLADLTGLKRGHTLSEGTLFNAEALDVYETGVKTYLQPHPVVVLNRDESGVRVEWRGNSCA